MSWSLSKGFIPTQLSKGGARNNLFWVSLPTEEFTLKQNQSPLGRENHECFEYLIRWALVIVAVGALLLTPLPALAGVFLGTLIGVLLPALFQRRFDLYGHTAEIVTAEMEGTNPDYREQEVERLTRQYPKRGIFRLYDDVAGRENFCKSMLKRLNWLPKQ